MALPRTLSTGFHPRFAVAVAAVVLLSTGLSTAARAISYDNRPKILLHAQGASTSKGGCSAITFTDCQDAVTEAGLITGLSNYYFVYLITGKGNMPDVSGLSFGISYQSNCSNRDKNDFFGVDIFSWTLCAEYEFHGSVPWPQPYSGSIIVWDASTRCQTGDVAVAGYFYCGAYSPDVIQIIARPVDGVARLATCIAVERNLNAYELGHVRFSTGAVGQGCNPCDGPCPGPIIPPPPPSCQTQPPPPQGSPAILLHVNSVVTKNGCAVGNLASCNSAVVKGRLAAPGVGPFYFVHLLANRGELANLAGVQCGISYDNNLPNGASNDSKIDVFSWTLCADLESPSGSPAWPNPGSGNQITWDFDNNCQIGNVSVAGYFYMGAYSADILRVTPRPVDGAAKLANCLSAETTIPETKLGFAAFSEGTATEGCNPCLMNCAPAVPVQATTWSGVKTLFR